MESKELINRYIYAVTKHLPENKRQDVGRELQSLIDDSRYNPALPTGHPFTGVQSNYYWTSTSYADSTVFAWSVVMFNGSVNILGKADTYYVWPVRGGQ